MVIDFYISGSAWISHTTYPLKYFYDLISRPNWARDNYAPLSWHKKEFEENYKCLKGTISL